MSDLHSRKSSFETFDNYDSSSDEDFQVLGTDKSEINKDNRCK